MLSESFLLKRVHGPASLPLREYQVKLISIGIGYGIRISIDAAVRCQGINPVKLRLRYEKSTEVHFG